LSFNDQVSTAIFVQKEVHMGTDQMTKTEFVVQVLNRDVRNIYKAHQLIAEKNTRLEGKDLKEVKRQGSRIGNRSGHLLESLRNPNYSVTGIDGQFQVQAYIPLYLRFFDMKHLGNWMIYNRQVWGILYNNSMVDIKYEYGDQVRDIIGSALRDAFGSPGSLSSKSKKTTSNNSVTDGAAYEKAKGRI
jgi:hypothetical protein